MAPTPRVAYIFAIGSVVLFLILVISVSWWIHDEPDKDQEPKLIIATILMVLMLVAMGAILVWLAVNYQVNHKELKNQKESCEESIQGVKRKSTLVAKRLAKQQADRNLALVQKEVEESFKK